MARHAGTERGATKITNSVFLLSGLVLRCFCSGRCNRSKKVARRARGSALARRFATVGEKEEKKF